MNDERDNAMAIAELRGEIKAIGARNEAMESRIDASLAENKGAMDRLRADMAKRETRLILVMAGMLSLAVAVLGLWLG